MYTSYVVIAVKPDGEKFDLDIVPELGDAEWKRDECRKLAASEGSGMRYYIETFQHN